MTTFIPQFIYEQYRQKKFQGSFAGTVLCLDIAGFTPLIQYAIDHDNDVREIIEGLNKTIFGPVVTEIERLGGFVAHLDGERTVAVFPHNGQQRALQTAVFIQTLFTQQIAPPEIESFNLNGRIALSTGQIDWGIPGLADKYTFYFYGTAVKQALRIINEANAGSIVADDPFWQSIASVHNQITAVVSQQDPTPIYEITAANFDAPPLAINRTAIPKRIANLFSSDSILNNAAQTTSALFENCLIHIELKMPTDDEAFMPYITEIIRGTAQFSGIFHQISFTEDSCRLSMSFGVLGQNGAEIKQAAECLRSIENSNFMLDEEQEWHVGMGSGLVWAGTLGSANQNRYAISGQVVQRIQQIAAQSKIGEIWVDQTINEHLEATYRTDPLGSLQIAQQNVPIYRLVSKRMMTQLTTSREIVGRQDELNQLHQIVTPLFAPDDEAHFAGLIFVDGDAGIGKSHFIAAFQRQLIEQHKLRWFYCPADAVMQQSLHPFKYALRQYFQQSSEQNESENKAKFETILDDLVQRLPADQPQAAALKTELQRTKSILGASIGLKWDDSLHQQLSPELRFENYLSAFKNFVKAEALCQPLIIQLEDSHWLDSDSQQLVTVLTRQMKDYPVAIISNARYDDKGKPYRFQIAEDVPQTVLDLSHFTQNGTKKLAEQVLEGNITADIVEFLFSRTKGNPFHIEQLTLDLNERGLLKVRENGHRNYYTDKRLQTQPMPRTINSLLISRLERMPTTAKQTLQSAAVLGQVFEIQVLSHMVQTEWQLPTKLEAMAHKQIWSSLGELQYLFKHALLWEAAYNMQKTKTLKERHRLALEAIQAVYAEDLTLHYGNLAYHSQKAGLKKESVRYYFLAGNWATAQFANEEAIEHYTQALALTSKLDLAQQYDLLLAREKIYSLTVNRPAQKQDLAQLQMIVEQTTAGEGADKRKTEVAIREAHYAQSTSDYDHALLFGETAVSLAEQYDWPLLKVEAQIEQIATHIIRGEIEEAANAGYEALATLDNISETTTRNKIIVLDHLGNIFRLKGDYEQSAHYYQLAYTLGKESGDKASEIVGLKGVGDVAWFRGDYEICVDYYAQGLQLCREIGDKAIESALRNQLGLVNFDLGNAEVARIHYEQGLNISKETGNLFEAGVLTYNLGTIFFEYQGELTKAFACYEKTYEQSLQLKHPEGEGYAATQLGAVSHVLGQFTVAESYLKKSIATFEKMDDPRGLGIAYRVFCSLYTTMGKLDEALVMGQKAIEFVDTIGERQGQLSARVILGRTLTALEKWDEAKAVFDEALTIRKEGALKVPKFNILVGLAELFMKKGEIAQAKEVVYEFMAQLSGGKNAALDAYLIGHLILDAAEDTQAKTVLETGHQLLQARAAKIEDDAIRTSYLEDYPANRKIRSLWSEQNK